MANTYFEKRNQQKLTYSSGNRSTQIDYILCIKQQLKNVVDCKVLPGECVAKQHRPVVCKVNVKYDGVKQQKGVMKTKW